MQHFSWSALQHGAMSAALLSFGQMYMVVKAMGCLCGLFTIMGKY